MPRLMPNQMRSSKILAVIRRSVLAYLFLSLGASLAIAQNHFDAAGQKQLVELINRERARQGVQPLAVDERLAEAARKHTQLMVKHDTPSHQLSEEQPLQVRVADEGLRSDRQAENVGLEMDVAGAHAMLMNSPAHRANILSRDYNAVGIGVILSGNKLYVTEDFAHRLPDYSDAEADAALQRAIADYASAHRFPAPMRKAQPALHEMACHMAVIDALDTATPRSIPGVHRVMSWTATEVEQLPEGVKTILGQPLPNGYSVAICFSTSATHPGGMYWIMMVTY
jgi:uncharacterized protein YkwD